ncbi:MAG: FAD-dependent oxidoreductase [Lachnospiraceae bacterium]|nr:FAD-dependent oxidoreductase [Lachnospiraceae bacterium]
MREYDADLGIIAAGPAGLAAAVEAVEAGLKVVVVEKSRVVGGAANGGMGPLGIGTRYQRSQMESVTVEKAFKMFMEYTHYNVDARLIKRYFSQSAETIEWLEAHGVEFEGAFRYFPESECTWHIVKTDKGIGPAAASFMNKKLQKSAEEKGVTFLFEHSAKKLIKENDRICGIIAETKEGEEIKINCSAAVVATGGAGGNKAMIKELTGFEHGKNLFSFAIPNLTGDGLRMAWEAGADQLPVRIEMAADIGGLERANGSVTNVVRQPNLIVNKQGRRIMNEEKMQNTTYLSNVADHQKDKTCFVIFDDEAARYYEKNGVDVVSFVTPDPDVSDFHEGFDEIIKRGSKNYFRADSIEELAENCGINKETLIKTVEEYNGYCDHYDSEFYKDPKFLKPIKKGPYFAAAIHPGGYGTVGGIRINENCEACDKDFEPVKGLYAAGADACNIYDDSYMFLLPGNSMGFALNTGRIAAKSAVSYINGGKK